MCTTSKSISKKLSSWEAFLDSEILDIKKNWSEGGELKYQLIGDNWDKNIIPTYRTSQSKTISLHLFNVIAGDSKHFIGGRWSGPDVCSQLYSIFRWSGFALGRIDIPNGHISNSKLGPNAWHLWAYLSKAFET